MNTNTIKDWMEKPEEYKEPGIEMIKVVGIDRKYHMSKSYENVCLCGIKILTKKENDVYGNGLSEGLIYSCYECTY